MAAANEDSSKDRLIEGEAQGLFKQYFGLAHSKEEKKLLVHGVNLYGVSVISNLEKIWASSLK